MTSNVLLVPKKIRCQINKLKILDVISTNYNSDEDILSYSGQILNYSDLICLYDI
jgi:hypothetical protein